jgi:hypothetical protein
MQTLPADLAPIIAVTRESGVATLWDIAAGLEAAGIATPRGKRIGVQLKLSGLWRRYQKLDSKKLLVGTR